MTHPHQLLISDSTVNNYYHHYRLKMLRWLKTAQPKTYPEPAPGLPDPNLCPTPEAAATCAAANAAIEEMAFPLGAARKRKRGAYADTDDETRLKVARYASEAGASKAARKYSSVLGRKLNESTVRGWVKKYKAQLKTVDDPRSITADDMAHDKRGPGPLLGRIDALVQEHIRHLRDTGCVVNRRIIIASATGIIRHHDRSLLPEHGGPATLTRAWAASLMERMGFVKRKGTKAARKVPADFPQQKDQFLSRITTAVTTHSIPPELIINFDQTGVNVVPVSKWTMDSQGAKQVEILGLEDKRQVTVLLGTTLTGHLLPPQVIYQGKTDQCHPKFQFPEDWHITHSENHWSTADTMSQYLSNILIPYFDEQREALDLPLRQRALVIMDVFRAHRVEDFLTQLKAHDVEVVFVPGGCTGELQPLDVSGNSFFKESLSSAFNSWYADQVASALAKGQSAEEFTVDTRLSHLKPLHARWLLSAIEDLRGKKDQLLKGWELSGISVAVNKATAP